MLGLSVTGVLTQLVKITVGRPRPGMMLSHHTICRQNNQIILVDLIARCIPPSDYTQPLLSLSTLAICTQTDQGMMRDGWRSFFSGHSSCESLSPFSSVVDY